MKALFVGVEAERLGWAEDVLMWVLDIVGGSDGVLCGPNAVEVVGDM